jgi:NitT/TauT family transport system substrate-binding protein
MSSGRTRRACKAAAAGTMAVILATACGNQTNPTPKEPPEVPNLTIGVLPTPSHAPLYIAQQRGYFKAEGLTVKVQPMPGEQVILPAMKKGAIHIGQGSNVPIIAAEADPKKGFKMSIIQEVELVPKQPFPVVVMGNSPIQTPADLRGKRIGINAQTIEELGVSTVMKIHGVDRKDVKFVNMPLPAAPKALATGQVDAAFLVDPYLTAMENKGVRRILDAVDGPLADIPLTMYASTEDFATKNPKTVKAFRRALLKAHQDALEDRDVYLDGAAKAMKADKNVLSATLGEHRFVMTTNPVRIQRIADMMYRFGYLRKRLNVQSMMD